MLDDGRHDVHCSVFELSVAIRVHVVVGGRSDLVPYF